MYLKYLTIRDRSGFTIRHIDFKKGVNIIKGEKISLDASNDMMTSTNSLGKTTLLRCIDFCLAGKWQSFVFDKEFKGIKNNTVFDFFKLTLPSFELCIVSDLESSISKKIVIKRNLTVNNKAKQDKKHFIAVNSINDNELSEEAFKDELKIELFNIRFSKPTLRQLVPKFIRTSDHQISNVINYLHSTTPNSTYEVLHLSLFDFKDMDLIYQKTIKEHDLKFKIQEVKSLKEMVGVGAEEINDVKQDKLGELQKQYNSYQIAEDYDHENDLLNCKKEELNILKSNISNLHLDIDIWQQRLKSVTTDTNSVDSESIAYMYQEAEIYSVELQKKYEETVAFHQAMLQNEIDFIYSSLSKNQVRLELLKENYNVLSTEYSALLKQLAESGSLAEYTSFGNQINQLTKEIAENEAIINKYTKSIKEQAVLKMDFETVTEETQKLINSDFRRKLTVFNRYFLEYSKDLSDEGYYLAAEKDRNQHFNLIPVSENQDSHVGDGRKQSIVIAFDLAYVSFADDPSISLVRPSFFTQDKIEIVDANMLAKLITLVNSVNCQFIFPIIEDKLNTIPNFDESNIVLTLSENNKFFDIENYEYNKRKKIEVLKYKPYSPNDSYYSNVLLIIPNGNRMLVTSKAA